MIRKVMDAIYQCVGGLDVHQETVVACRRRLIGNGQAELEIRTFKTTSADLGELAQWLAEWNVRHVAMRTGVINRIHSVLEQGNIKLSNVASNIMGVSGRAMIKAMSNGESDPAKLAAFSQGRLKADFEQLVAALDGQLNENQRWLLKRLLGQVKRLEEEIAIYSERIAEQMRPYQTPLERLDTIGGIGQRSAENLLAEIGPDMSPFPTDDQLVSWGAYALARRSQAARIGAAKRHKATSGSSAP